VCTNEKNIMHVLYSTNLTWQANVGICLCISKACLLLSFLSRGMLKGQVRWNRWHMCAETPQHTFKSHRRLGKSPPISPSVAADYTYSMDNNSSLELNLILRMEGVRMCGGCGYIHDES
jgi:hypothetical protein